LPKVMLCVHQFYPRFYTGTEALTLSVAEEMTRRGYEVVIFTVEICNPGEKAPDFIANAFKEVRKHDAPVLRQDVYQGLPVWRLYMTVGGHPIDRMAQESDASNFQSFFETVLAQEKPDVVHAFHLMWLTGAFVKIVKKQHIPVYFTATDFWMLCPTFQLIRQNGDLCLGPDPISCFLCMLALYAGKSERPPLKFALARAFPRLAGRCHPGVKTFQQILQTRIERHVNLFNSFDGIMWSNSFLQNMFHRNGFKGRHEAIVPFPVPERAKDLFTMPPPGDRDRLQVAFIGTLHPSKGPQVLVETVLKIDSQIPIELSIWGSETYPAYLDRLQAMAKGDRRIRFCGTFPQEAFASVLEKVDVVVIPSLWYENTPLTALSVLAARRVLVATDLGGLSTVIEHERNGFLFPPGDVHALKDILLRLTRERHLIQEIGANISPPSRVNDYVDNIVAFYESTSESWPGALSAKESGA